MYKVTKLAIKAGIAAHIAVLAKTEKDIVSLKAKIASPHAREPYKSQHKVELKEAKKRKKSLKKNIRKLRANLKNKPKSSGTTPPPSTSRAMFSRINWRNVVFAVVAFFIGFLLMTGSNFIDFRRDVDEIERSSARITAVQTDVEANRLKDSVQDRRLRALTRQTTSNRKANRRQSRQIDGNETKLEAVSDTAQVNEQRSETNEDAIEVLSTTVTDLGDETQEQGEQIDGNETKLEAVSDTAQVNEQRSETNEDAIEVLASADADFEERLEKLEGETQEQDEQITVVTTRVTTLEDNARVGSPRHKSERTKRSQEHSKEDPMGSTKRKSAFASVILTAALAAGTTAVSAQQEHFPPVFFDGDNCAPEQSPCTVDVSPNGSMNDLLGRQVAQISIVWGVNVSWNGTTATARKANNGENRCSLVAVPPNNYLQDVTIVDGRWETYNVDPTRWDRTSADDAGWLLVLAKQRADEQSDHFGCPYLMYEDIQIWTSGMASPPESVEGFDNFSGSNADPAFSAPEDAIPQAEQVLDIPDFEEVIDEGSNANNDDGQSNQECETVNCRKRVASSDVRGGNAKFQRGDAVLGADVTLNGKKRGACFTRSAKHGGTVKAGVINPWKTEWRQQRSSLQPC